MDTIYYVYILRCKGDSLYTGITTDVKRRFEEHCGLRTGCAKYTRVNPPICIERVWQAGNRASASRLEYHIKTLSKQKKEELIESPNDLFSFFGDKLNIDEYSVIQ